MSALLATLALCPVAHADAMPHIHDSWFLPVGVSLGYAIHGRGSNGFAGGAELSLVHDDSLSWQGAYIDVLHDFGSEHTRLSLGPEIGSTFFGIDGGYVLDTGNGLTRHGACIRPMFSLGVMMLYGRVEQLFGTQHETLGEIGLLLKFPVLLHQGENPDRAVLPEPAPVPSEGNRPAPGPFAQPPPQGP